MKYYTIVQLSATASLGSNTLWNGYDANYDIYKVNRKNIFLMRKVLLRGRQGLFAPRETFPDLKI